MGGQGHQRRKLSWHTRVSQETSFGLTPRWSPVSQAFCIIHFVAIVRSFEQTIKILSRALYRSASVVRPVFVNRTRGFAKMALNAASHNIRELLFLHG